MKEECWFTTELDWFFHSLFWHSTLLIIHKTPGLFELIMYVTLAYSQPMLLRYLSNALFTFFVPCRSQLCWLHPHTLCFLNSKVPIFTQTTTKKVIKNTKNSINNSFYVILFSKLWNSLMRDTLNLDLKYGNRPEPDLFLVKWNRWGTKDRIKFFQATIGQTSLNFGNCSQ